MRRAAAGWNSDTVGCIQVSTQTQSRRRCLFPMSYLPNGWQWPVVGLRRVLGQRNYHGAWSYTIVYLLRIGAPVGYRTSELEISEQRAGKHSRYSEDLRYFDFTARHQQTLQSLRPPAVPHKLAILFRSPTSSTWNPISSGTGFPWSCTSQICSSQ